MFGSVKLSLLQRYGSLEWFPIVLVLLHYILLGYVWICLDMFRYVKFRFVQLRYIHVQTVVRIHKVVWVKTPYSLVHTCNECFGGAF